MDLKLSDKAAIVTGGSRGIGLAIAKTLADEGARVAICARSADEVDRAVADLKERSGDAFGMAVDVTDTDALNEFIDAAGDHLGGFQMLVASAGGLVGGPKLAEIDADDWRATFDLNVNHPAAATRAAVPWLERAGGGSVLFIASIAGMHPWTRSHYGATKAGVIHLAGSLARELGPAGIRVNAISPGSILFADNPFDKLKETSPEGFAEWERAEFPFGRLGTLDEVADAACFLLSDRASWVTGANLPVDGGQNPPNMVTTLPLPGRWLE
jgi:3-oxoacyl-[acyl-carrier protein] reductase